MFAVFLALVVFTNGGDGAPVNVALQKEISALFTCGTFGDETYYDHKDLFSATNDRDELTCSDATIHPPSAMVDGDPATKWQSTNFGSMSQFGNFTDPSFPKITDKLNAVLYIDLKQSFTVERIILQLGDAKRPKYMAVYKKEDITRQYDLWASKVTTVSTCNSTLSVPVISTPSSPGEAVCGRYSQTVAASFETIEFDFTGVSIVFREWKRARYLRIEFYEMERSLTREALRFHHFAVSELSVMAECVCNGHAVDCLLSSETGIYECVCGGNTVGQFCERCQPFYNQKAWQYQVPCEECNCNGHATECTYSSEVEARNGSVNQAGVVTGGGECLNCKNNTAGVNCERCLSNYYRPADRPQTDPEPCVLCNCTLAGSLSSPISGVLGDCLMNIDYTAQYELQPGECFCKSNVTGPKCDTCKDGYFGLSDLDPNGCQECGCSPNGTVGANPVCVPDTTGQCTCKDNAQGRTCSECKDGFYGLSATDPLGCQPCECDVGGAMSTVCEKTTGQCTCRARLEGRQCNSPVTGSYFPDLHFINVDFADTPGATVQRTIPGYLGTGYIKLDYGELTRPPLLFPGGTSLSGSCALLIRYSTVNDTTVSIAVPTSDDPRPMTLDLPGCPNTWCYRNTMNFWNVTLLDAAPHVCRILSMGLVYLDRLVCVPTEFLATAPLLGSSDFDSNCDVINNDIKKGQPAEAICQAGLLSLMSYYLDGGQNCDCSRLGGNGTDCEPFEGQCVCKVGVGERRCDQCEPGYYQLSATGCTSCSCASSGAICDVVTGQCECPPNTIGLKCDQCDFNTWGWNEVDGCQECNCNTTGSEQSWCNITTGVCTCKSGVEGDKCDTCVDEYKAFTILGCSMCDCDAIGSNSTVCDKVTGQCSCKENVGGLLCNECKAGSFHLDVAETKGCLDCICMGVASLCQSSDTRQQLKTVNLIAFRGGQLSSTVSIVDGFGADLTTPPVEVPSDTNNTTVPQPSLMVPIDPGANVYWKIPDFSGNLLSVYGGTIEVEVQFNPIVAPGVPVASRMILIGRNNKRLVNDIAPFLEAGSPNSTMVTITESAWKNEADLSPVTRGEFLLALSDVSMVLLPTVFGATQHASFLLRLVHSNEAIGGTVAVGVENCQCDPAYTGMSCQDCATGYKRANVTGHPYLGLCVPCQCNNHASTCDPDTGACINCLHNTAGAECEVCAAGYYGTATVGSTIDCNPCPCLQPRVVNNTCTQLANMSVSCNYCNAGYTGALCDSCMDFHYGNPAGFGSCTPCDCNGNTNVCNAVTGQCVGCQGNTEGDNCERCIQGFYFNTEAGMCEECGCSNTGSLSTICEPVNGTCTCHPGIGGRTCDRCQDYYWGYDTGSAGCLPCDCVEAGSVSLQCDNSTGFCACRDINTISTDAASPKCDQCIGGFFGLPNAPCQPCACDITGTDAAGGSCNLQTGQCPCKPGVAGRQCDQCQPLHINFGDAGCEACDTCESSLGNDSARLELKWQETFNVSQDVAAIQQQDIQLQVLTGELVTAKESLGITDSVGSVSEMTNNITAQETAIEQQVGILVAKVQALMSTSGIQKTMTYTEEARQQSLLAESYDVLDLVRQEIQNGNNDLYLLGQYNLTAQQYMGANSSGNPGEGLSFDTQLTKARSDLLTIQTDQTVENMGYLTTQQETSITAVMSQETGLRTSFTTSSEDMAIRSAALATLQTLAATITANQEAATQAKAEANNSIAAIQAAQSSINTMVTQVMDLQQQGAQAHSDCQQIMNGNAQAVQPALVLPAGVINWNTSYARLQQLHTDIENRVVQADDIVSNAELMAQNLDTDALVLNTTFNLARSRGESAVTAIQNFEKVIVTLDQSLAASAQAKTTIEETQATLQLITVASLEAQANASQADSIQHQDRINAVNYQPGVLQVQLDSSRSALVAAENQWPLIDQRLAQLQQMADNLNSTTGAPAGLDSTISETRATTSEAEAIADSVALQLSTYQTYLDTDLATAQSQIGQVNRAVNLTASVQTGASSLRSRVDSTTRMLESISQQRDYVDSVRPSLDEKIQRIEDKLVMALDLLAQLQNPVKFNGTSGISVSNPTPSQFQPYTDVRFRFKMSGTVSNALLFFAESPTFNDRFCVEIVDRRLVLEYVGSSGSVTQITSPADLCDNCWFQLQASKYNDNGQLTLILLSTGGIASASATVTPSASLYLQSDLYFGSLPESITTPKVTTPTGFLGCLYDVYYNGLSINLWKESVDKGRSPNCCQKPSSTTQPLPAGISFTGFGQIVLANTTIDVTQPSLTIMLRFRTFSSDATLFHVGPSGSAVSLQIRLVGGFLLFQYGNTVTPENQVQSTRQYNDGKWYMVSAMKLPTVTDLQISGLDDPTVTEDSQDAAVVNVDLSALVGSDVIIGSNEVSAASARRFAGCMNNVMVTGSGGLITLSMMEGVVSQSGVSLDGCPAQIILGINFLSPTSYMRLSLPSVTSITSVTLDIVTTTANGILLFIQVSGSSVFYLTLFNGNLVLDYFGSMTTRLSSTDIYIADGLRHSIRVDLSARPVVLVDNTPFLATTTSTNVFYKTGTTPVYLGGVPSGITLSTNYPIKTSFVGHIIDVRVNNGIVNPFATGMVDAQSETDLSGVPEPPTEPAPIPYTTPPPPTTPAPPVCGAFQAQQDSSDGGRWFSGSSYWQQSLQAAGQGPLFYTSDSFTLSITFESFSPNGLLFLAADSTISPSQYVIVYLKDAMVHFRIQGPAFPAEELVSQFMYNDGRKYSMEFVVYGTFFIMIESNFRKDYAASNGDYNDPHILTSINTLMVGGVQDTTILNTLNFLPASPYFQGAVYEVLLNSKNSNLGSRNYDLLDTTDPTVTATPVSPVPSPALYGVALSGFNSYVNLGSVTVPGQLSVSFKMSNIVPTAMLFYIRQTQSTYIAIDINDEYRLRVTLAASTAGVFTAVSDDPTTFCDSEIHTYKVTISGGVATIEVDENGGQTFPLPAGVSVPFMLGAAIVGGLDNVGIQFSSPQTRNSVEGCVQEVIINGELKDPPNFLATGSGLSLTCPSPAVANPV